VNNSLSLVTPVCQVFSLKVSSVIVAEIESAQGIGSSTCYPKKKPFSRTIVTSKERVFPFGCKKRKQKTLFLRQGFC